MYTYLSSPVTSAGTWRIPQETCWMSTGPQSRRRRHKTAQNPDYRHPTMGVYSMACMMLEVVCAITQFHWINGLPKLPTYNNGSVVEQTQANRRNGRHKRCFATDGWVRMHLGCVGVTSFTCVVCGYTYVCIYPAVSLPVLFSSVHRIGKNKVGFQCLQETYRILDPWQAR